VLGRRLLIALVAVGLAACGPGGSSPSADTGSSAPTPAGPADPAAVGRAFIEALAAGDTATAESMEDAKMRAAAPAAALGQLWDQIETQFGAFAAIDGVVVEAADPYINATVQARFANAMVPLIVTVTDTGQVAGLHLGEPVPASGAPASASPSAAASDEASPAVYVDRSAFTETEVIVGSDPYPLPGTLSMPTGEGPFPAVVLVAGSGPQDRDETIGPNKPLRDLAWGLASNGIATLRYEKRTKAFGPQLAAQASTVTVQEEAVDDAVAAVDLLRDTPGIDPDRVLVAGHSLGGFLAPRIAAAASGRVAGIALLEANASPLEQMLEAQLTHLASDEGGADPQAKAMLEALPAQLALLASPGLSAATPASSLPLGIPAAYWLDLRGYDPAAVARDLPIPIFIAQGGRDYQVPPSQLALWRRALADRDDVTIREYPAVNHLLMAGSGPTSPAEYATPAHVAPDVVADLVTWVRGTE
jgi:dienelactone hydrolase